MRSEQRYFIEMDNCIAEAGWDSQEDPATEFGYYYHTLLDDVCNSKTTLEAPSTASTSPTAISYGENATTTPIHYTPSKDDEVPTSSAAASVTTCSNYIPKSHPPIRTTDQTETPHHPPPQRIYNPPTPGTCSPHPTPLVVNCGRGIVPRGDSVIFFSNLPFCAEDCYNDLSVSGCPAGIPYEECLCLPETLTRTDACAIQHCQRDGYYPGADVAKYRAAVSAFCNRPTEDTYHPPQPPSYSPITEYSPSSEHPIPPEYTPPPPYSSSPDYTPEEAPTTTLPPSSDTITTSGCETETPPPPPSLEQYEPPTYCATLTETPTFYIQGPGHKRQVPTITTSFPLLQGRNNLNMASSPPPMQQVSAPIISTNTADSHLVPPGVVEPASCWMVVFLVLGLLFY